MLRALIRDLSPGRRIDDDAGWLVEVKSNRDAGSEDVQAKRLAAITWANTVTNSDAAGTWRYLLLTEDDVVQTHGNWKQMKTLA